MVSCEHDHAVPLHAADELQLRDVDPERSYPVLHDAVAHTVPIVWLHGLAVTMPLNGGGIAGQKSEMIAHVVRVPLHDPETDVSATHVRVAEPVCAYPLLQPNEHTEEMTRAHDAGV